MDEFKTIPGQCYYNALSFAYLHQVENLKIVHGKVEGNGELNGFPVIHAWVECSEFVYDHDYGAGRVTKIKKKDYYKLGNIDKDKLSRYSLSEAATNAIEQSHCGPWDEDLRAHSEHEEKSLWDVRPKDDEC